MLPKKVGFGHAVGVLAVVVVMVDIRRLPVVTAVVVDTLQLIAEKLPMVLIQCSSRVRGETVRLGVW